MELTEDSTHAWWRTAACAQFGRHSAGCRATPPRRWPCSRRAGDCADGAGAEAYLLHCLGPLAEVTGRPGLSWPRPTRCCAACTTPAGSAWLLGADAYLAIARAWLAQGEPARAAPRSATAGGRDADRLAWACDAVPDLAAAYA